MGLNYVNYDPGTQLQSFQISFMQLGKHSDIHATRCKDIFFWSKIDIYPE